MVVVDASTLEANAAMKSIVRRDTGEGWSEYVRRLMEEDPEVDSGPEGPTEAELRRYHRRRGWGKKVSNKDWKSGSDPDARITQMKDGRTRRLGSSRAGKQPCQRMRSRSTLLTAPSLSKGSSSSLHPWCCARPWNYLKTSSRGCLKG